jgi:hypothetical protein
LTDCEICDIIKTQRKKGDKKMKLYVLIINNGHSYEDNEDKVFGVYSNFADADYYGKYYVGDGRQNVIQKLWGQEEFGFDEYGQWEYEIKECELNKGLY